MCRAPRKAVPISLVSDSTTPRGGKRGPSTLCVLRNQAHINGGGGTAQNGEGCPGAKAGTPKLSGGPFAGQGGDGGMTWSPSSAPTTPSGKGDVVSGLPFSQVQVSARLCNTMLRGHSPCKQASYQQHSHGVLCHGGQLAECHIWVAVHHTYTLEVHGA